MITITITSEAINFPLSWTRTEVGDFVKERKCCARNLRSIRCRGARGGETGLPLSLLLRMKRRIGGTRKIGDPVGRLTVDDELREVPVSVKSLRGIEPGRGALGAFIIDAQRWGCGLG